MRRAALATTVCGASACTLVTGVNELGVGDDGGSPDVIDTDASDIDGGPTNTTGDPDTGPPPADSSALDVLTGPMTWCSSVTPAPRACLDFDAIELDALDTRLESGVLAIEDAGASAPNALLATIDDDKEGRAFVRMSLGASPPTRVAWSFDVRLDRGGSLVEIAELRLFYAPGSACAIQPQLESGQVKVNEYCEGAVGPLQIDHVATSAVDDTGYYHFAIVVDFGTRKLTAQVRRPDGVTGNVDVALDAKIVPARAEVRPGVSWAPARTTGARVLIDNVTVDWQ